MNSPSSAEPQPCHQCERKTILSCSRCGDSYCSIECQELDWDSHRYICMKMPLLKPRGASAKVSALDEDDFSPVGLRTIKSPINHTLIEKNKQDDATSNDLSDLLQELSFESNGPMGASSEKSEKKNTIFESRKENFNPNRRSNHNEMNGNISNGKSFSPNEIRCFQSSGLRVALPNPNSKVLITSFHSANRVYIRELSPQIEAENRKNIEICNSEGQKATGLKNLPKRQQLVYAPYVYGNIEWARGCVIHINSEESIRVTLSDFGVTLRLKLHQLREITSKGKNLLQYVTQVQLHNVGNYERNDRIHTVLNGMKGKEMVIKYAIESDNLREVMNNVVLLYPETNKRLNDELISFFEKSSSLYSQNIKADTASINSYEEYTVQSTEGDREKNKESNSNGDDGSSINSNDFGFSSENIQNGTSSKVWEDFDKETTGRKRRNGESDNSKVLKMDQRANSPLNEKRYSRKRSIDLAEQNNGTLREVLRADQQGGMNENLSDEKQKPRKTVNEPLPPETLHFNQRSRQNHSSSDEKQPSNKRANEFLSKKAINNQVLRNDQRARRSDNSSDEKQYSRKKDYLPERSNGIDDKRHSRRATDEEDIDENLRRKIQTPNKKVLKPPFDIRLWDINEKNIQCTVLEESCIDEGYFGAIKIDNLNSLQIIFNALATFQDDEEPYKPSLNEYCLAKYEQDWARAKVVEMDSEEDITVIYIDFKNESIIKQDSIRRYPDEMRYDCYTVLCQIFDFPNKLNDKQRKFLVSKIGGGQKVTIDRVVNINDEVVVVEMRELIEELAELRN